jgi:acarbose 7IV-phosphotransferase
MVYLDEFPPPRPGTIFARGTREAVGSSGAGKALNLSALGAEVTLWGLVGDDEWGDRIRRVMADAGVEFLSATDPAGTMRHINLMDAAGDRVSIFANAGTADIDVDVGVTERAAAAADLVAVTILPHCRAFLPMLQRLGSDIWVDIHDYDGVNPYHDDFIDAANHLQMSSIAMADWRPFLEARVAAGAATAVCTHGAAGASGLTAADGWVDVPARTGRGTGRHQRCRRRLLRRVRDRLARRRRPGGGDAPRHRGGCSSRAVARSCARVMDRAAAS